MRTDPETAALLFDFYGDLLTGRQREFYDLYHNHDLSLSEIAENAGITRQGVRDALERAGTYLRELEDKLGLVMRFRRMREALVSIDLASAQIAALADAHPAHPDIPRHAKRIRALTEECLGLEDENQVSLFPASSLF
ncbi:MAG: DNA-binding protein [Oscillospiraceae bacterium]|nr:DNA-binding protein [Oscillospiraceae bacterium]